MAQSHSTIYTFLPYGDSIAVSSRVFQHGVVVFSPALLRGDQELHPGKGTFFQAVAGEGLPGRVGKSLYDTLISSALITDPTHNPAFW